MYKYNDKINTTDGPAIVKTIIQTKPDENSPNGYTYGVVFLNEDGSEKIDTRYYAEKFTGDNPAPHVDPVVEEPKADEVPFVE